DGSVRLRQSPGHSPAAAKDCQPGTPGTEAGLAVARPGTEPVGAHRPEHQGHAPGRPVAGTGGTGIAPVRPVVTGATRAAVTRQPLLTCPALAGEIGRASCRERG